MLQDVVYKDAQGYTWLVRVREGTPPELYSSGIRIGPPDLSGKIDVSDSEVKKLQAALVNARLVNAELIRGSADKLYRAVHSVLPVKDVKRVVLTIKSIYQHEYYTEEK